MLLKTRSINSNENVNCMKICFTYLFWNCRISTARSLKSVNIENVWSLLVWYLLGTLNDLFEGETDIFSYLC